MFLLLKELSPPDGLPARTHPLGRGVFNETPSPMICMIIHKKIMQLTLGMWWSSNSSQELYHFSKRLELLVQSKTHSPKLFANKDILV